MLLHMCVTIHDNAMMLKGYIWQRNNTIQIKKDWINEYHTELPNELPLSVQKEVEKMIIEWRTGKSNGRTIQDVAKIMYPYVPEERAINLAGSEITRAASCATNAHQRYLNNSGVNMIRSWITENDPHVCAVCTKFHKQPENVWASEYPKGPPAHEGCRCAISLRLDRTEAPKKKDTTSQKQGVSSNSLLDTILGFLGTKKK